MFRNSETMVARHVRQDGSALTVAILLLLLLTIAVFAAMPAMLGEQRVSGNDVRSKIAQHVADAGLSHGREFLRIHQTTVLPANGQPLGSMWASCTATSRTFPCGAIDPDLATSANRANYYYYDVGAASPAITFPSPGKMYDGSSTKMAGNFEAEYEVGILLCRLNTANDCVTDPLQATGTALFTLVSRGSVDGERASATVQETIGAYKILDIPPELPPLIASGTVQGVGNATVVGNPNSGGFGIPLILWSYQDFDSNNGSWQSCQMDEYLRSGIDSVTMQGSRKDVPICALGACNCSGDAIMSENGTEGIDVLDSNSADGGMTVPSTPYWFPPDLVHFVLDFDARRDEKGLGDQDDSVFSHGDYDETLIDDNGNGTPDVEEFLAANANQILTDDQCDQLNASSEGLVWIQGTCALSTQVGSVDRPVILVMDGDIDLRTGAEVYGILLARATAEDSETCIPVGSSKVAGCPFFTPGGGTARIFGSLVIEGGAKPNGNIDLIFIPQLIRNINEAPTNYRFAGLAGSWSDRVSY
jgi:Tfp pilus assembly protein PilX